MNYVCLEWGRITPPLLFLNQNIVFADIPAEIIFPVLVGFFRGIEAFIHRSMSPKSTGGFLSPSVFSEKLNEIGKLNHWFYFTS